MYRSHTLNIHVTNRFLKIVLGWRMILVMRGKGVNAIKQGKILETKKRNESSIAYTSVQGAWLGRETRFGDEGVTVKELEEQEDSVIKDLKENFLRSVTGHTKEESRKE